MYPALFKSITLFIPIVVLFIWSLILFSRTKTSFTLIQLLGAGLLVIVVLTHIFEALSLFQFMQWGSSASVGHYVDLTSAVAGLILFATGFLLRILTK